MPATSLVERLRFRRAPLLAAAVWFALGILWADMERARNGFTPVTVLLGALTLLCLLSVLALWRAIRVAWLATGAAWLVVGFAAQQWQPSPAAPRR